MTAIRGVLFDKDGTLVDSFAGWIGLNQRLFEHLRTKYPHLVPWEEAATALGIRGGQPIPGGVLASGTEVDIYRTHHRLLGAGAPPWGPFWAEVATLSRELFRQEPPEPAPIGRVASNLRWLRDAGLHLGIATSDSYLNASRDLARLGGDCIEFWATADRLDRPKPDPESVNRFAAAVGLEAAQIAFVGDSPVDLACARAANVGLFVAVASATCPPEVQNAADHVVTSIDEIPALIGLKPPAH